MIKLAPKQRLIGLLIFVQLSSIALYFWFRGGSAHITPSWRSGSSTAAHQTNETSTDQAWPQAADGFIGAIVAAARERTDMQWIAKVREQNWLPQVYNVDAPYQGEGTLTVARNKGHEAMVYLTYMIDNYSALPPYTIFIHGHLESWHQNSDIYTVISDVRLSAVDKQGYVSLRCDWYPSCPAELRLIHHDAHVWGPGVHRQDAEDAISIGGAWHTFFPGTPMAETIASQCCAQFIVTKEAIRRNKKEDYIRMRQWILDTDLIDDVSGRVLEKLWAYIMTGREVNCPSPQTCSCEFFGKCDKRKWPVPPLELGPLPEDSRWP